MEAPKSTGEAVATTEALDTKEEAGVTDIPAADEAATISDALSAEAIVRMSGSFIAEKAAAMMEVLAEAITISMAGPAAVILFYLYLGIFYKEKGNNRSFIVFLFSSAGSIRREIVRQNFRTPFSAIATAVAYLAGGAYYSQFEKKVDEKRLLLLPTRRRAVVKELSEFKHVWSKRLGATIKLQGTAVRFGFYAGEDTYDELVRFLQKGLLGPDKAELAEAEQEWKRLGELIEQEKAALFVDDYWEDNHHYYSIEAVFSDEGHKAKGAAVPRTPREKEEAKEWFWRRLTPLCAFSLFIIHWAILMMLLLVLRFLYQMEVKRNKEQREDSGDK